MRKLTLVSMLFISTLAFCQEEREVVAKFKNTERLGNFLTRWYYDVLGTSLAYKERLTLYSDSTYNYVFFAKECGIMNQNTSGRWELSENMLTLYADELPERTYQLMDDKIYHPLAIPSGNNWVMK